MPANVMVFLQSEDYRQHGTWALSLAERLGIMDRMLTASQNLVTQMAAELTTGMPFKGVYLAPEYYFTAEHEENKRWPLTEEQRVQLEPQLLALSAKFPEILIVPGTMFYAKPLVRTEESFQHGFDPATGTRTRLKSPNGDRRDKALQKLDSHIKNVHSRQTEADPAFWRTWNEKGYSAGAHAVPALSAIQKSVKSRKKNPWILRNSAYILLGPRRIAKYDKQTDWGEALGNSPDDLAFIPGVQKQCPEIGGYRVGMEVCADHGNGMLARRQVTPLHFHFVVSDCVPTSPGNMAMSAGGYFAHASTNYSNTALYLRGSNGVPEDITKDQKYWKLSNGCQGKMLDSYVVPLPPPIIPQKLTKPVVPPRPASWPKM